MTRVMAIDPACVSCSFPVGQVSTRPGIGGVIELVSGALIAVGFVTGAAAFVASGMMAAAYFMAHFPAGFWPMQNDGELSVLYCFLFLYMAMRGSGIWSVEAVRVGR
jgi:putative oxidoreductase